MRIALFGGTGRVGRLLLEKALRDGHSVTALVRAPEKQGTRHERLRTVHGNVLGEEDVRHAVRGCEAVFSALSTDGGMTLSAGFPHILAAMNETGARRIVTIGTAGILNSRTEPGKLRYQTDESRRSMTRASEEHHTVLRLLEGSGLDWTIVCPTYMPDEPPRERYRAERSYLPANGSRISVADTASFAYGQLADRTYARCTVGIAY